MARSPRCPVRATSGVRHGSGNDTLIGVDPTSNNPGMNETDRLNRGAGNDTFVIGDKNNPYYVGGEELMVSMTLL
ncbi:hypothetical protein [Moorena sp. SIO4G3]|uniref:hypothetical protein n=1 Tax=Moorena sp. SIO4G3 TaxID=2607821 RepID=UPI00142C8C5E|nr:hypothetical protein [Moorena sp. SIO4G3]NEO78005.1 hypothetical protein [Moorena sp. SIO4G3]